MAIPIYSCDFITDDQLSFQVALSTVILLILAFFMLPNHSQESNKEQQRSKPNKTPVKRHNLDKTIPEAPMKKRKITPISPKIAPVQLFTEPKAQNETLVVKGTTKPIIIKDLRTIPSNNQGSFSVVNYLLTLSSISSIEQALSILSIESGLYDFTAPVSQVRPLVLSYKCITEHVQSLINIKAALTYLNKEKYAMPHSGNGYMTTFKDGKNYLITDKVFNAICQIKQVNYNLSKALKRIYQNNKRVWSEIPKSFEDSCALAREAHILSIHNTRLHTKNSNMTSWAEW